MVLGPGRKRSFMRGHAEGLALVAAVLLVAVLSVALSVGAQTAQAFLRVPMLNAKREREVEVRPVGAHPVEHRDPLPRHHHRARQRE